MRLVFFAIISKDAATGSRLVVSIQVRLCEAFASSRGVIACVRISGAGGDGRHSGVSDECVAQGSEEADAVLGGGGTEDRVLLVHDTPPALPGVQHSARFPRL